jgi:hypothetical protein
LVVGGASAALLALAWTSPAAAYVRRKTDGGIPEYWQASCVSATIYLNGFNMMTRDEVAKSIAAAAHTWSPDAVTCGDGSHPYFEVAVALDPDDNATAVVQNDAKNSIIFQTQTWPDTLSPYALAVTSAFAKADGRILDSDIQINATAGSFLLWANLDPNATDATSHGNTAYDLQNAITHEFGHFIGLDHTCIQDFTDNPPLDNAGNPVPNCGSAPADVQMTVMWPLTDPGETHQRFLTSDEVQAVCDIYPAARDPHNCALDALDDGIGCSTGAPSPRRRAGALGFMATSGVLLLALARRRIVKRQRKRCAAAADRSR